MLIGPLNLINVEICPYSGHIGLPCRHPLVVCSLWGKHMTYSRIAVFYSSCNTTIVELLHYIIDLQKQLTYITNNRYMSII